MAQAAVAFVFVQKDSKLARLKTSFPAQPGLMIDLGGEYRFKSLLSQQFGE